MTFQYLFWAAADTDDVVRLSELKGFDEDFELEDGIAHAHDYPDDAHFDMNPDFPDSTVLADRLNNSSSLVVISPRLTDFVKKHAGGQVEFLATRIINHKGKLVPERYSIVNPIGQVPILDLDQCDVMEESTTRIERMGAFVVIPSAVPADRPLFRPEKLARYVLIRRDLAKAIDAAGFTGNRWVETSELVDVDIPADLSSLDPPS